LWAGLIPENKEYDGVIDANGIPDQVIKKTINDLLESLDVSDFPYLVNEVIAKALALAQPQSTKKKG